MPLWRLFYHLVWATEQRRPLITPTKEQALYKYIDDKTTSIDCHLYAIGGTDNHIHLIVAIPPKLVVSAYVKQIKGASSHYLNHSVSSEELGFEWQNRVWRILNQRKAIENCDRLRSEPKAAPRRP